MAFGAGYRGRRRGAGGITSVWPTIHAMAIILLGIFILVWFLYR